MIEGYYDNYQFTSTELTKATDYQNNRTSCAVKVGDTNRWEFVFCPNVGFLGSPDPLIKDCELKLSFDRAQAYNSVLRLDGEERITKPFEIKDVVAISEYVSSESMINYFDKINYSPVRYEFDDCDVLGLITKLQNNQSYRIMKLFVIIKK